MSIIRVGLAETKKFAAGYEAIFGKAQSVDKPAAKTKKPVAKNKTKKK